MPSIVTGRAGIFHACGASAPTCVCVCVRAHVRATGVMCDDVPTMTDAATTDPYDALGDLYDEWVVSVVEDIPFYVAVADTSGSPARIVELGAGSGRVTVPLLSRGHEVWGVDVAGAQLARAAAAADSLEAGSRFHAVECDMRVAATRLPRDIDLVIAPFRSLLHVAPDAAEVLASLRDVLRPGGRVAFDVFHPTPDMMADIDGVWQLRRRLERAGDERWAIWERATHDAAAETLTLDVRCDRLDDPTQGSRAASMELHVPPPHHWSDALAEAGFTLESVSGWFDESPFDPSMPDSVWVARRDD